MNIETFDAFLQVARAQTLPQRLLFVFANAELPDEATLEQRAGFEAGYGGALVPTMCVDKSPDDVSSFDSLSSEAAQFAPAWSFLFAGAIDVPAHSPEHLNTIESTMQVMVESIKRGDFSRYLAFNNEGITIALA